MELQEYLEKTNTSVYLLSKNSGVPYSTTLSICRGKANIEECRLGTLRALAKALGVSLTDLIDGNLSLKAHRFIDDSVELDVSALPSTLQKIIAQLERYDREGDIAFYACADTMMVIADRMLHEGTISESAHEKLELKYPIEE